MNGHRFFQKFSTRFSYIYRHRAPKTRSLRTILRLGEPRCKHVFIESSLAKAARFRATSPEHVGTSCEKAARDASPFRQSSPQPTQTKRLTNMRMTSVHSSPTPAPPSPECLIQSPAPSPQSPQFRLALALILSATLLSAQQPTPSLQRPALPAPIRSYLAPTVPPIRLTNSLRLQSLLRAGNLYLTVQDALALAIENNLNLEIDRYGPLLADSAYERSKAGGAFRGVQNPSSQVNSIDTGLGASGSLAAQGLLTGNTGSSSGGGGGAVIQQVGQVTPVLDPIVQNTSVFSHLTNLVPNLFVYGTPVDVQTVRTYSTSFQQGFVTGGGFYFLDYEQYLHETSPLDSLNPAVGPLMEAVLYHSLLQGFGAKVNDRTIRITRINTTASREQFRSQVLDLCANVLRLYWDLVSARDELRVRRQAVEITQKFYDDTKYEISIGAMAPFELITAEAELATRRQDALIDQDTVEQRSLALKQMLSHAEDPALEAAQIIPLDHIDVPDSDNLPPFRDLLSTAMAKRPDVAVSRFRDQTDEINLIGTTNPLLPSLTGYTYTYDRGVAGVSQASGGGAAPFFVGGYGNALGQIFRRDFPNNGLGVNFSVPIRNSYAQGDYGYDQLRYQQSQLSGQKDNNQIAVDVANQANALRQARAHYTVALNSRILQQQLLEADQKRATGIASFNTLMTDRRALIAAEISVNSALAAYANASVSLDQVLGETLERNNITLDEGLSGRVKRQSTLPDVLEEPSK
jgi:outer membrane protein